METYKKRIGFAVSAQSLMIAGGIGQFTLGFIRMCHRLGYVVDLIVDQPLNGEKLEMVNHEDGLGNIYYPELPKKYTVHQTIHMYSDSVNFEKEANFRDAFMRALSNHVYDFMVCNVPETFAPWYSLGMQGFIPAVFYTHNENFVGLTEKGGPYSDQYNAIYRKLLTLGTVIGTQTESNRERMELHQISDNVRVLTMPMYEDLLLKEPTSTKKSGMLFIGRWEERKNPQEFIDIVAKLDPEYPVKIITNKHGVNKFVYALRDVGHKNSIIFNDISSGGKAAVIMGSKFFVSPATKESFGYTSIETLGHCMVLYNDKYEWSKHFSRDFSNIYRYKNVVDAADYIKVTDKFTKEQFFDPQIIEYQQLAYSQWSQLFEGSVYKSYYGSSTRSRFGKPQSGYVTKLNLIGRDLGVEDIASMYNALGNYEVVQTRYTTWIANDGSKLPSSEAVPPGEVKVDSLFEV
jgi:glycosyltransferase involved in cell wall biosynthesis